MNGWCGWEEKKSLARRGRFRWKLGKDKVGAGEMNFGNIEKRERIPVTCELRNICFRWKKVQGWRSCGLPSPTVTGMIWTLLGMRSTESSFASSEETSRWCCSARVWGKRWWRRCSGETNGTLKNTLRGRNAFCNLSLIFILWFGVGLPRIRLAHWTSESKMRDQNLFVFALGEMNETTAFLLLFKSGMFENTPRVL